MRFPVIKRLSMLGSKEISRLRTLELQRKYVEGTVEHFQIANARGPWNRKWWKKWRLGALSCRNNELQAELNERYEGVLNRVLDCCGVDKDRVRGCVDRVWRVMKARVLIMEPNEGFAGLLWAVVMDQTQCGNSALQLRPKFLLRQFIEEMPSGDSRGVLLVMAYEGLAGQITPYTLRNLREAYSVLHQTLKDQGMQVGLLTNKFLMPENLNSLDGSLAQYEKWLFSECGGDDGEKA